jgi:putative PIN family toxin of toxin-antitoxin system
MITAILDTNVFVQAVIGSPQAASRRVLDAYDEGRFQLHFSSATIDELFNVIALSSIRARHRWSDDQILRFVLTLAETATVHPQPQVLPAHLVHDVTDIKFLALAAATDADYLVTNDRRHLLPLGRFRWTRIVTPAQFLKALA